jgi:hypothetical protein
MNLDAPYPHAFMPWENFDFLFSSYLSGHERSGHDRAEALHDEDAVDGQPKDGVSITGWNIHGQSRDLPLELV